jgi:hypothetical protein
MQQRRSDEGIDTGWRRGLALALVLAACGSPGGDPDATPPPPVDGRDGMAADGPIDAGGDGTPDGTPDGAPDASVDGATPTTGFIGDNGAILEGAVVDGTGPADRREVAIEALPGSVTDLVLGRAFLTRSSPSSERSRLVVEITNRGSQTYCDVAAPAIQFLDAGGSLLGDGTEVIWASVRDVGGFTALTCLLPGERTFLLDSVEHPMASVATVKLRTGGAVMTTAATTSQPRPVGYDVTAGDVSITVENRGTRTARVTLAYVVYLDGDGLPLGWTSARAPADADVAAGASIALRDSTTLFLGASSDLYVRVMYTEP